ncbi:MAG: hypothetical protein N3B13_07825 [Deltaproteobacteria bacterium]|nr:hypothetical protein [Deltaproteobacteria bacterium]
MKREDTQMSAQKEQEAQPAEDAGLSVNTSDAAENPSMMHPNIRFVQTPDGKMVPEAAFKLKLPKMLNSQFLKNAVKEQKEEESKGKVETEKEESR